jgi:hypothetical protein
MKQLIKMLLWEYLQTGIYTMHSFQKASPKLVLIPEGKQMPVPLIYSKQTSHKLYRCSSFIASADYLQTVGL